MRAIELAEQLEYSALGNLGDFAYVADAAKELRRLALVEIKWAAAEIELATANANLAALRGQEPVYASDNLEYSHEGMGCGLEDRGITDRYEAMQYGWDEAIESMDRAGPFYTAPAQPIHTVPEGWKMVPEKPTYSMQTCTAHNLCSMHDFSFEFVVANKNFAMAAYTEFLNSAPQPPGGPEAAPSAGTEDTPIESTPRE